MLYFIDEYQFYTEDQSIIICPIQKHKAEYENMIDNNKPSYKLIVHNKKNVPFKTADYHNIHHPDFEDGASNKLYYLNILINSINGRCKISARHTFIYYVIFSTGDLTYFIHLIKYLTDAYRSGGVREIQQIINMLNKEADLFQTVFNDRKIILNDMKKRCILLEDIYKDFENEDLTVRSWIDERLNNESSSVIEFSYKHNNRARQIARRLLYHIKELSRILSNGKLYLNIPETPQNELLSVKTQDSLDLNRLDAFLPELEILLQKEPDNFVPWSEKYMFMINEICGC